ncbi:hypothetical protein HMPREF3033_01364 [Veillonellaceae bacterium DNF00751]|nr:hypothetical protein HMPREF3033_01364 [Veillonellaceae bacterium DNF00751]
MILEELDGNNFLTGSSRTRGGAPTNHSISVSLSVFFPHTQILGILLSDFVRGDGGGKRKKEELLSYARMVGKRLFFCKMYY